MSTPVAAHTQNLNLGLPPNSSADYERDYDHNFRIVDFITQNKSNVVVSGLAVTAGAGLTVNWAAGSATVNGTTYTISSSSGSATDNTVDTNIHLPNYIFINNSGAVTISTSLPTTEYTPLAIVFTNAGSISKVVDGRKITSPTTGFGGYKNLVIANDGTNPNYQLDITADNIQMVNSSDALLLTTTFSKTVDITASGADGLDTGSEANSTWYHIWAIGKADGTVASLLSLSTTAPTMPSGYTYKLYLGAVYNGSGGHFIVISQKDRFVSIASNEVLTNGTSDSSFASISLATAIPSTAKKISGHTMLISTSGSCKHYLASNSDGTLNRMYFGLSTSLTLVPEAFTSYALNIITAQTIWYKVDNGTTMTLDVNINGWEF